MANTNGVILYQGPSQIDSKKIVVVATGLKRRSKNAKTGDLVQTWILVEEQSPLTIKVQRLDTTICGGCVHSAQGQGSCYVNVAQAPQAVWKAYRAGNYPKFDIGLHGQLFAGRYVRFGAYGDPAAVPLSAWHPLWSCGIQGWTGYTHQWRRLGAEWQWLMASADTAEQAKQAWASGWRTFRVAPQHTNIPLRAEAGELGCLSETKGITCEQCRLCNGKRISATDTRPSIVIAAHGIGARKVA